MLCKYFTHNRLAVELLVIVLPRDENVEKHRRINVVGSANCHVSPGCERRQCCNACSSSKVQSTAKQLAYGVSYGESRYDGFRRETDNEADARIQNASGCAVKFQTKYCRTHKRLTRIRYAYPALHSTNIHLPVLWRFAITPPLLTRLRQQHRRVVSPVLLPGHCSWIG